MINPALCINHVAADVSPRTLKIFSADSRRRLRLVVPMLSPNGVRAHHGPIIVRGRGFGAVKAVRADDADHPPRRRAFTLIELLVVCGVLGILASLIAASLMSAKAKARQVQCLANLHQHGLALNVFLADHHEYPLAMSANVREQYPHHHKFWEGALFSEQLDQRDAFRGWPKIFDCPAASRPKEFPAPLGYADYGYNACGLGGLVLEPLLGIGGKGPGLSSPGKFIEADYPPPVRESDVVNPSEMLAIGDGFNGWKGVIKDGLSVLGRGPDAREFVGSTRRSYRRHSGRGNVLFCDGHVGGLKLEFLFQDETDQALRIWNRDNQPHRERLDSLK